MKAITPTFVKESNKIALEHDDKITYRYNGLIESPFVPGFYLIPEFSRYVINHDGELRRHETNKIVNWQLSKHVDDCTTGGYRVTSIYNDNGDRVGVSRHRLKMIVFSEYDFHPSTRWVNHKNGIPGDDDLDNLEWVTPRENVQHAYNNNLHPNKVKPVNVLNWETGEELNFVSTQAAADYFYMSVETIRGRLRRGNDKRYSDHLRFKYPEDTWLPLNSKLSCFERANEILVISESGHCSIYVSSNEASKATGVNARSIRRYASVKSDKKNRGYLFRYLSDD